MRSSKNNSDPTPQSGHVLAPAECCSQHPRDGPEGTTPTPWLAVSLVCHAEPTVVASVPMVLQWALTSIPPHSRPPAGARLGGVPEWFYQLHLHPQTQRKVRGRGGDVGGSYGKGPTGYAQ